MPHKDFVIGDGITEALLQARSLAAVIMGGGTTQRWSGGGGSAT